jgi:hypothetical protein
MGISIITTFVCSDGKEFTDHNLAVSHENDIETRASSRFTEWTTKSYSGKRLLEKHSLNEVGTWRIRGEDPNCGFGGHHYQPELGTVEGKLRDVIQHAVKMDGFYTWGGGGDIVKVTIKKV